MIRIVIADDHHVVREGMRTLLELDPELRVVGEAANGAEAVDAARALRPDVVVMDLVMPELDGIAATRLIRQEIPETEVVALTSVPDGASVVNAVHAGVAAYILKDTRAEELRHAIKAAAAGRVRVSPRIAARVLKELRPATTVGVQLSSAEVDLLRMLAVGRTNEEMASILEVGEEAIRSGIRGILSKLGVQSRTLAALHAAHLGLIPLDEIGGSPAV